MIFTYITKYKNELIQKHLLKSSSLIIKQFKQKKHLLIHSLKSKIN